jgi:tRNA 2-thiouridine synthesizing protein A
LINLLERGPALESQPAFEGIGVDKDLNLKGKICPYTFLESMLTLEEMAPGEVLRVVVDYAPAACDVPRSLRNEGYDVLDVSQINETDWAIVVRNSVVGS